MKKYDELSKTYFIKMYTEYLAYELYLHLIYFNDEKEDIEAIWGTCQSPWVLTPKEEKRIFKNAKEIFKDKYELKSQN